MTQIYQSFEVKSDDTLDERMTKLYMGIISVGEDLYCKGSAVAELNKEFMRLETVITEMRRELAALKALRAELRTLGRKDEGER